jgi:hypothetical protein
MSPPLQLVLQGTIMDFKWPQSISTYSLAFVLHQHYILLNCLGLYWIINNCQKVLYSLH